MPSFSGRLWHWRPAALGGNSPSPIRFLRTEDAVQLIRNYYRWINQKKYQGAFNIWEKREDGNAANGQSFEKFESGFSDTASVSVEIGEPGEIEGAAGSNYIEIPVVISARDEIGQSTEIRRHLHHALIQHGR